MIKTKVLTKFFTPQYKDDKPIIKWIKLITKSRSVKGYENKSEDVIVILSKPKTKISLSKKKIRDIKENFNEFWHKFFKSKIHEIRRSLHDIQNPKNVFKSKIQKIEKNRLESLSGPKKYYNYGDIEYKGIKDVGNLFNQSTDEDYYKPIKTTNVFDNENNYIEYESTEDKNKNLSIKEYLNMIRPYLSDSINDHKTHGEWKVHSGNKVIDYKTEGEWKSQLTMTINFIF